MPRFFPVPTCRVKVRVRGRGRVVAGLFEPGGQYGRPHTCHGSSRYPPVELRLGKGAGEGIRLGARAGKGVENLVGVGIAEGSSNSELLELAWPCYFARVGFR
jgi:hypothetical protein